VSQDSVDPLLTIQISRTGVELADELSHKLGLRSNGVAKSLARRNKYHMGENVRNAGEYSIHRVAGTSM
jgi:hypothetical protein